MKTKRHKHITNHRQRSIKGYGRNCTVPSTVHRQSRKKSAVNSVNYKTRTKQGKIKTMKRVIMTGGMDFKTMQRIERSGPALTKLRPLPEPPESTPPPIPPNNESYHVLKAAMTSNSGTSPQPNSRVGPIPPPRPTGPKPTSSLTVTSQNPPNPMHPVPKSSIPPPPPLPPMSRVNPNVPLSAPPPPPPLPPPFSSVNPSNTKPALGIPPPAPPSGQPQGQNPLKSAQGPGNPAGNKTKPGKQPSNTGRNALLAQIGRGRFVLRKVEPNKGSSNESKVGKQGANPSNLMASLSAAMTLRRAQLNPNSINPNANPERENEWE